MNYVGTSLAGAYWVNYFAMVWEGILTADGYLGFAALGFILSMLLLGAVCLTES